MAQKRRRGGMVNLSNDANGRREPGNIKTVSGKATVLAQARKTSSSGFKAGGAITGGPPSGNIARRARGGRTGAPFSSAGAGLKERDGRTESGHEGE